MVKKIKFDFYTRMGIYGLCHFGREELTIEDAEKRAKEFDLLFWAIPEK